MKANLLTTTIAQKIIVGLSGLLLCGFLIVHLAGNLLIYLPSGNYAAYNAYAHAIHANALLPVAEIGLLVLFLMHIALTLHLVFKNRSARPHGYAVKRSKRGKTAVSAQNVMHWTGVVVLAFLILHMLDVRFGVRFPEEAGVLPSQRILQVLHDPLSATLYTLGSLLLGYHLYHGFRSGFETLGAANRKITPYLDRIGLVFAVIVALGFASFPLWANFILK